MSSCPTKIVSKNHSFDLLMQCFFIVFRVKAKLKSPIRPVAVVSNQAQFCPQGDIWESLETFLGIVVVAADRCYRYLVC